MTPMGRCVNWQTMPVAFTAAHVDAGGRPIVTADILPGMGRQF
jgi:hypothetical protein